MTLENNLVGPQSDERGEKEVDMYHSKSGEPLWMALLSDEETLVLDPNTVHEAKNKLMQLMQTHGEEIVACQNKSTEECRELLSSIEEVSGIAE